MWRVADLRRAADHQGQRARRWWCRRPAMVALDEGIHDAVLADGADSVTVSKALVDYFWQTYQHYLVPSGTLAYYPGWPSIYGATNDAIEGVSRLAPLWAAYASSPYVDPVRRDAMWSSLRQTLIHGTDPAQAAYWGDIGHRSTLICEAADLALAVWLGRDTLWPTLDADQQARLLLWLRQAVGKRTADNNWHLFVVLIDAVLVALDPSHRFSSDDRLKRVQSFARADGCFTDGPDGPVDFYNAWGFHYLLYWLAEIDATRLDEATTGSLGEFCRWYQWLFTARGLPLFGRSLCYRFAACTPLISCAVRAPQTVPPGVALSAYMANWRYFVQEGGLRAGRPTQGVFKDDIRWLDPYSGPASSLWGTRSLVMFFYTARSLDWRQVPPLPLPALGQDKTLSVQAMAATVRTHARQGECSVEFNAADTVSLTPVIRGPGLAERLREMVYGVAVRPANNLRKAGCARFSSKLSTYR